MVFVAAGHVRVACVEFVIFQPRRRRSFALSLTNVPAGRPMSGMVRRPDVRALVAQPSSAYTATVSRPRPLRYGTGADAADGLPAHVRAASAIRRRGSRLVIVQDDVNAIAVLDPATGSALPLLLPEGPQGARVFDDAHGNKKQKLDLEACVELPDGRLLALGSGSSRKRERIVCIAADARGSVDVIDAGEIYTQLRSHAEARGAELNIEGAVVQGRRLRLLQRGNGKHGSAPWNAILDLALDEFLGWLDERDTHLKVRHILEVDLGEINGVPFGFTDATIVADGRIAFLACAEDSADALSDGPMLGCRFGWLAADDSTASMTVVIDDRGRPTGLKLEGIERREGDANVFDVVADMDQPEEPAQIATLTVFS